MNRDKQNDKVASANLKPNLSIHDSCQINAINNSEEFLSAGIDTPKPFIIKKLSAYEQENLNTDKTENHTSFQKSEEQKFPFKILIGIIMFAIGLYCVYLYNIYNIDIIFLFDP